MRVHIIFPLLTLGLLVSACSEAPLEESIETSQSAMNEESDPMKLTVLINYASEEKVISEAATAEELIQALESIDWQIFHQVVLEKSNGDWIDVGGNLGSDGLSVMYEEDGIQLVIVDPPTTVDQMKSILLSYLAGDGKFKAENKFD